MNLAKITFTLKYSVKLCRYLLWGCVTACHGMACVLYVVQNATTFAFSTAYNTHTPFHDKLPHNRIINIDVFLPNVLK